jgi:protein-glucosylgalactosylhydroxylysine glucosidase
MTWAIAAIGHLDSDDIDSTTKAAKMFKKSYEPYVRAPFHVWSEVIESEKGAVNFLTGIGGFLQSVLNGYAGIRIGLSNMTISKHSQLLPNTTSFSINGLMYLGSKFKLDVVTEKTVLTCLKMNDKYPLKIKIGDAETTLIENNECKLPTG